MNSYYWLSQIKPYTYYAIRESSCFCLSLASPMNASKQSTSVERESRTRTAYHAMEFLACFRVSFTRMIHFAHANLHFAVFSAPPVTEAHETTRSLFQWRDVWNLEQMNSWHRTRHPKLLFSHRSENFRFSIIKARIPMLDSIDSPRELRQGHAGSAELTTAFSWSAWNLAVRIN